MRDPETRQKAIDTTLRVRGPENQHSEDGNICAGPICTPFTEEAYQARMSDFHREEMKRCKVKCHVCQEKLAVGPLKGRLVSQHVVYQYFLASGSDQAGPGNGQLAALGRPFLPRRGHTYRYPCDSRTG